MLKKIVALIIVLITVFALTACGTDLALDELKNENRILKSENEILTERISELELELNELSAKTELMLYKLSAVAELKDYVAELNKDAYIYENWTMIKYIAADGKADIDLAKDKAEVDGALSDAIAAIDDVERKMGIIREKLYDSWWDGRVDVFTIFPRIVKQGESFEVKVITKNLLDEDIVQYMGSCCAGQGVLITAIKHQTSNYEIAHWHFDAHNDNVVSEIILSGEQLEAIWIFTEINNAPIGVYDIYLANGEVYRNAITII